MEGVNGKGHTVKKGHVRHRRRVVGRGGREEDESHTYVTRRLPWRRAMPTCLVEAGRPSHAPFGPCVVSCGGVRVRDGLESGRAARVGGGSVER